MSFGSTIFGKTTANVAQGASDPAELVKQQDLMNRQNIISDFGGRTIGKDASGRTTVTLNESAFQKSLRELQEQKALGIFSGDGDFGREATEKAIFERGMSLMEPTREADRKALETSLSLKGLPIGSEAFQGETGRLSQAQSEELRQLGLQAVLAGGQESRNELASQLGSVSQVMGGTQYLQGLTNIESIDVAGIFQNADAQKLQRSAQENERRSGRLSAISGAFSGGAEGVGAGMAAPTGTSSTAAAMTAMSDIRLKKNIKRTGEFIDGIEIVEFNYNKKSGLDTSKRYRGAIAQEVEKIFPEAVGEKDGYKFVYYSKIGINMEEI